MGAGKAFAGRATRVRVFIPFLKDVGHAANRVAELERI